MRKLLVCGDRVWADGNSILLTLMLFKEKHGMIEIIEGEAKGADTFARLAGEKLDCPVHKFPAEWKKYGRGAGPIRNKQMLIEGKPDLVIAFHDQIEKSKGTLNMLNTAVQSGVPAILMFHGKETVMDFRWWSKPQEDLLPWP
jgi:hypothetical protein